MNTMHIFPRCIRPALLTPSLAHRINCKRKYRKHISPCYLRPVEKLNSRPALRREFNKATEMVERLIQEIGSLGKRPYRVRTKAQLAIQLSGRLAEWEDARQMCQSMLNQKR